jgi:hypothetical protein
MGKKDIRSNFRNSVFKRDGHKCMLCKKTIVKLDAHHITNRNEMPNGGYVISNGITLCDEGENGCHFKVEEFYFSEKRDQYTINPMHPNNLYKLIGSSKEKAIQDSKKL